MAKKQPAKKAAAAAKTPSKKAKPAALALAVTTCERDEDGLGCLPFVEHGSDQLITQQQISAAKATLLAAGFESLELTLREDLRDGNVENAEALTIDWENDGVLPGWRPQASPLAAGEGWILVAVLEVDDSDPRDAVALFARKPGAWPFPKTESGVAESSTEVSLRSGASSQVEGEISDNGQTTPESFVSPAMTKTEAIRPRKGFFTPPKMRLLLVKTTPHKEHHGKDLVQAVSLRLRWETTGESLNLLHPNLQAMLFYRSAPVEAQEELPDLPQVMPNLRVPTAVLPLKVEADFTGYTFEIEYGIDESTALELYTCHLHKYAADAKEGGGGILEWTLHSNKNITPELVGILCGMEGTQIVADLTPPTVTAGEAIDGSVGHPGASAPLDDRDAGDLFTEAHGRDVEGSPQEPGDEADDPDGAGPREPAEEAS